MTVNQTLTSLAVSPSSVSVAPNTTRQFSATATDQFGASMTLHVELYRWRWRLDHSGGLFTAGGSAGGPFTVTASGGGKSGTASVTVSERRRQRDPVRRFLGFVDRHDEMVSFDRISDQTNGEVNCSSRPTSRFRADLEWRLEVRRPHVRRFDPGPGAQHYTSWQIQQKTAPFLYGTVEVRAKQPGGTGIWPTIWMLGF